MKKRIKTYCTIFLVGLSFISCSINDGQILTGLDVLLRSKMELLRGKNLGIITNHTAVNFSGVHIIDTLINKPGIRIRKLFGPEHGIQGNVDRGKKIEDSIFNNTGIQVISLYGKNSKPTAKQLQDIDLLIFDIQDVGTRFYTYTITLRNCLLASAENNVPIMVLDRPNPINGITVSGPILPNELESNVGISGLPIRYGMTIGELAKFLNMEIGANLEVVRLENWKREYYFDDCGLPWIAPSPNMTDIETALVYPGMCLLEGTNISEGRGTNEPFLIFGAPFINSEILAAELEPVPGIKLNAIKFTPRKIPHKAEYPKFKGIMCNGLKIKITDRAKIKPIKFAKKLLLTIRDLYPDSLKINEKFLTLLYGDPSLAEQLLGKPPKPHNNPEPMNAFLAKRNRVLLYK